MFESGNIKARVDGNTLHLEIDISKTLSPSKSGKTVIVATTSGNQPIPGTPVVLGLNAYIKR